MTPAGGTAAPLERQDFLVFRDFIRHHSGIFLRETQMTFLATRLARRMQELGIPTHRRYLEHLRGPSRATELLLLLDEVVTGETSFWRHAEQIETMMRAMLPQVAERCRARHRVRCRIWSAACATGEEPYSLAIALDQCRVALPKDLTFEVVGTDLSERHLEKARAGSYTEYALRNLKAELRDRYFVPDGSGHFRVKPALQSLVHFRRFNLIETQAYEALGHFDVVFCRNVLIYFDELTKARVVGSCTDRLEPGGFLVLAPSESLIVKDDQLELIHMSRTIAYRKLVARRPGPPVRTATPACIPRSAR